MNIRATEMARENRWHPHPKKARVLCYVCVIRRGYLMAEIEPQ